MTKKITFLLIAAATFVTFFFISSAADVFAPTSSGGIASTTCAGSGCHNGSGLGVGTFEIIGLPTSYTPGQPYNAQICITDPSADINAGGFSMYQDDFVSNAFSPGDGTSYLIANNAYLTHNGKKDFTGNTACWKFVWNAPEVGGGTKSIGAAGNAVNSNGGPDNGDHGDYTIMPLISISEGALPVDLVDFSLSKKGKNGVLLNWETATEINNDYFQIERSYDVRDFETIGKIKGNGNTSDTEYYSFTDENPEINRPIYYRLKQVDFDGAFEYSLIKKIIIEQSAIDIQKVYPNPVFRSEMVKVKFELFTDVQKVEMIVYDIAGHEKMRNNFAVSKGENIINFSPDNFVAGQYFISLIANNQRIMSDVFIVTE